MSAVSQASQARLQMWDSTSGFKMGLEFGVHVSINLYAVEFGLKTALTAFFMILPLVDLEMTS